MKKLLYVLCAAAIVFCFMSYTAFAEDIESDDGIAAYSLYVGDNISKLSISGKTATCKSTVTSYYSNASIYITQTFQKKSGSTWTNVSKVSKMFYSSSATFTKTYSSLSSGTYRVVTEARVYVGSNSEKNTAYSSTKSC